MEIITLLSWVGVFALAIGSLISIVSGGGLITAVFGVLLTSITISSIIPLNSKLRLILGAGGKLETMQRIGVVIGAIGSWVLAAGAGGWEFVPAGVVLSVAAMWWPAMRLIEWRRARRNTNVTAAMISEVGEREIEKPELPPQYTANPSIPVVPAATTTTVTIITEDAQSPLKTPSDTIKVQTPIPIYNV